MDDRDDLTERRYQVGGMIQGRKNQVWVTGQVRGELAQQDGSGEWVSLKHSGSDNFSIDAA